MIGFPLRGSCHEVTDEVSKILFTMENIFGGKATSSTASGPPSPQGEGFRACKTKRRNSLFFAKEFRLFYLPIT